MWCHCGAMEYAVADENCPITSRSQDGLSTEKEVGLDLDCDPGTNPRTSHGM